MNTRRSAATLVTLVGLIAMGCASSGAPSAAECRSDLPPDGRSLAEALDSAALHRALRDAWPPGRGLTVATVRYDSLGMRDTAFVAFAGMSDEDSESLGALLDEHTKVRGEPQTEVNMVLGDAGGPGPRRVPELRRCVPALLDRADFRRTIEREAGALELPRSMRVRVQARVLTDGTVGEVTLYEGSGNVAVNQLAVSVMQGAAFTPAYVEGIPFRVWVRMPITIQPAPPLQPMIEPPSLPR